MSTPKIATLFRRSPTRALEEVQKVNATAQAEQDVEEFYETSSARQVLGRLSALVREERRYAMRFLYLHATFGSGKTHLLKLIGFATGEADAPQHVAGMLSDRSEGFFELREAIGEARADVFKPVFLNLLNRDPAEEPPIPLLMFRALARSLGYRTDLPWLPEWALRFDSEHGLWDVLQDEEAASGLSFEEALADRGVFRTWMRETVPTLTQRHGTSLTEPEVRESIAAADAATRSEAFGPKQFADRVLIARDLLEGRREKKVDFLFGLDEIALFIGQDERRFEELKETVEVLMGGPNPIVLGTGQWSLAATHQNFFGESSEDAWYANEARLEGADTEDIVRKRWLRKTSEGRERVEVLLEEAGIPAGERGGSVEAYPFRDDDLRLLRQVMQGLLTGGHAPGQREHVQGRALLVIVRALFARFEWGEKALGSLVPWDRLFDLLVAETTYVPTWIQELIERLERTVGQSGDEGAAGREAVRAAKTVYLLNRAEDTPATAPVVARLLAREVNADVEALEHSAYEALAQLADANYAYAEKREGEALAEYRLLTQQEVTLAERAQQVQVPRAQVRAQIEEWIREREDFLIREGTRQEKTLAEERDVPVLAFYSTLREPPGPRPHPEAVAFRVLADSGDLSGKVQAWQKANRREDGLEDLLVAVQLPGTYLERLRDLMATDQVLSRETRRYPELEAVQQEDRRVLRRRAREALREASVYTPAGEALGTFAEDFAPYVTEEVLPAKFPERRTPKRPLQEREDARRLAQFFQGTAEWPLASEDAQTLGVNRHERAVQGGWADAFFERFEEGTLVDGEELMRAIEAPGGAFLGSSRDALAALLLTLGAARRVQLRLDGQTQTDPEAMAQAVRTRADLERLRVRLSPPAGRHQQAHLRSFFEHLTGEPPASDDPEEVREAFVTWAQEHHGAAQEVRAWLGHTFSQADISMLMSALGGAARGARPEMETLTSAELPEQAKTYSRARALRSGAHADLWKRFEAMRATLQEEGLHYASGELDEVFDESKPPTGKRLRKLLNRAEEHRKRHEYEKSSGESGRSGEEEPPRFGSDLFGNEEEEDTDEEVEAAVQDFMQQLEAHLEGRGETIVVIEKPS